MAREVQPKRAEDFFALAEQVHEADPLAARAIEISGRIAELRHFAYELALERAVPVGEIDKITQDERIELRKQTHALSGMYAKQSDTENYRVKTRLALHAILMNQLVLTPALQTYPEGNAEANSLRQNMTTGWLSVRGIVQNARDHVRAHPHDLEAINTVTDATIIALGSRPGKFLRQILPALIGRPYSAEAEMFVQTRNNTVKQTFVCSGYFAYDDMGKPGVAMVGRNHLGLAAQSNEGSPDTPEFSTITAIEVERQNMNRGSSDKSATQTLDALQETMAARISAQLVDYPLETALALPPI